MIRFNKLRLLLVLFSGTWIWAQEQAADSISTVRDTIQNQASVVPEQNIFNTENSKRFAEYLFKTGQYRYATEEFQRVIFLNPQDNDAKYYLVLSYIKLKEYPEASQYFLRYFPRYDTLPVRFQKQAIRLSVLEGDYADALQKLAVSKLDSVSKQTWQLGLSILDKRWEEANRFYQAHASNPDPVYHQFGNVVQRRVSTRTKSPFLAGALSAVVPGLGKVYTKNYGDAAMAFLFTGVNVWQAYRGFSKDGTRSVHGWIFAFLGTSFYLGNIFGSVKAAKRYNQKIDDDAIQEVKAVFDYRF